MLRPLLRPWFRLASAAFTLTWMSAAQAEAVGPREGAGQRHVGRSPAAGQSEPADGAQQRTARVDHRRGRAPASPQARLPAGAEAQPENLAARRAVAGVDVAAAAGVADPELELLRAADKSLFPRSLVGFRPGWSWGPSNPDAQAVGLPPVIEAMPSGVDARATESEWLRSLAMPDFPVRMDARVVEYLKFYRDSERGRSILRVWARKVGRYTAAMRVELAKAGLPRDLVWLSLIESGHNPTIYSPAGAAGLWQFIPESGRMYGLTVDRWVDERLDPQRSTQAAAKFLSDLYRRFGTWELAMAAYNMGHAGLLRAIRKYNTNDFWKLSRYEAGIPWETTLYVPKVFAMAIVMNNRRAFGIAEIPPDPAVTFDTVFVQSGVSLEAVAEASGIPVESLRSMNPQYLTGRTPAAQTESGGEGPNAQQQRWPVRVPRGTGQRVTERLLASRQQGHFEAFVARFGDTLDSIAARYHTTTDRLCELNQLDPRQDVTHGSVLLVPRLPKGKQPAPDTEEHVVVPSLEFELPTKRRIFYRVLQGDTLAGVAHALRVTPQELAVWNDLDRDAKLQSGLTLQAFVPDGARLAHVRHIVPANTQVYEVGSDTFLAYFEALNGRKRIVIRARPGDNLARIGQRHQLSVGMMERINRMSRHTDLQPGQRIVVYTKRAAKGVEPVPARPLAQVEAPHPEALPNSRKPSP